MTDHISDEQMLALLHGELPAEQRAEARRHLADCASCARTLAHEAALDEVLREARRAQPAAAAPRKPARHRHAPVRWWLVGAAGLASAAAVGAARLGGLASSAPPAQGASQLLAWQNVIFYIPLAAGLLLIVGSAFGGHDGDGGHDHDHDAGHDHGEGGFARALSILGVGRVPLTIVLMLASLIFGGLGIILNTIFVAAGVPLALYVPISIGGALAGMVALTGAAARLVHKVAPTTETYVVTRRDFAGCVGKLLLPADETSGLAQVKDHEGNIHNIKCRTLKGALPKGSAILVVEYDAESQTFVVDQNPA